MTLFFLQIFSQLKCLERRKVILIRLQELLNKKQKTETFVRKFS